MNCWHISIFEIRKRHDRVVDLVHYEVESVHHRKSLDLHLTSPFPVLLHVGQVALDCFIVFHKWSEVRLIFFHIGYCVLPILSVVLLIAFQLIRDRPKQTVSISSDLSKLESILSKLFGKLDIVRFVLYFLQSKEVSLHSASASPSSAPSSTSSHLALARQRPS